MTLQEFVCDSMLQISNGVEQAKRENKGIGIAVKALGNQSLSCTAKDETAGFLVEFDVALTVSAKGGKEMGGSITVASFLTGGGKKSSESESSSVSRLRFCVPIVFK